MGKLDGKVAVITGSGRGVGKATAKLFAEEGAAVVINDIDKVPVEETVKEIEALGGKAAGCVADITKPEEAQRLIDTAGEKFGDLHILINNAGLSRDNRIDKMTDSQWDICIDINLKGPFNCIRAASKYMMKEEHVGRIVNVTSLAALAGNFGQINYSAAKAGVIGITKTVAKEWAAFGVTCNAVAFGGVDTRFTAEKESSEEIMGEKIGLPKKFRDAMIAQGARFMTPEEAARTILFLVSDDAASITGHVLNVTSGIYM